MRAVSTYDNLWSMVTVIVGLKRVLYVYTFAGKLKYHMVLFLYYRVKEVESTKLHWETKRQTSWYILKTRYRSFGMGYDRNERMEKYRKKAKLYP